MIRILVLSHGDLAEGLLGSVQMIAGEHAGLDSLSFAPGMGVDEFTGLLSGWLAGHDDQAVLFCDMLGGTPFNVAATAAHADPRLRVIYGVNLSIVLEAVMSRGDDLDGLIDHLSHVAPISIGHAKL